MGKDILCYLNLSYNSISGFEMLPWKDVGILDLHSNLLQGALPTPPNSTFFFSVSHNKLSGEISSLICKASSMRIFYLSNNNLMACFLIVWGILAKISLFWIYEGINFMAPFLKHFKRAMLLGILTLTIINWKA